MREDLQGLTAAVQDLGQHVPEVPDGQATAVLTLVAFKAFLEAVLGLAKRLWAWKEEFAGHTLRKSLDQLQSELQERARALEALREELAQRARLEEVWRRQEEEIGRLQTELDRLQRLEDLVQAVDLAELRQQVEQLRSRREVLEAGDLDAALVHEARGMIHQAKAVFDRLDEEKQRLLQEADDWEKRIRQAEWELQEARERNRLAQLRWPEVKSEIGRVLEANSRVARALPDSVERQDALAALEQVERLIRAGEEALRIAIENNEAEQQRKPLWLGGAL